MREPLIPENLPVGCSSVFPAGEIPIVLSLQFNQPCHGRIEIQTTYFILPESDMAKILGLKQNEFSITTDFFRMNPLMRNFDVQLNITRCIDTGRKITCSSGLSTLKIKVTRSM